MAKKTKQGWRYSRAKNLLVQDIRDNTVMEGMAAVVVYEMHQEYHEFELKKFKTYLAYLRKVEKKKRIAAEEDRIALANFREQNQGAACPNPPEWSSSVAKTLLRQDIDAGEHERMKPIELYNSRPQYQIYSLHVFRNHIYDELRRDVGRAYWLNRSNIGDAANADNDFTVS